MDVFKSFIVVWVLAGACTKQDGLEPSEDSPVSTRIVRSHTSARESDQVIKQSPETRQEKPLRRPENQDEGDTGTILTGGDTSNAPVTYPEIMFQGTGVAICNEDVYLTTATIKSRLTDTMFVLQIEKATVTTDVLEDKLQEEIDNNLTEIQYGLVPVSQRGKIDGKDLGIFATSSLHVKQDIQFKFSSHLPVYVWPAAAARFDELRTGGPKSWKATVTGKATFEATVTMRYVRGAGNRSTIRLETFIKEDVNGELYQDFPIPKIAEITVDGDRQLVERSKNEHLFDGDDRCDDTLGIVRMDYEACTRTYPGKVEDFGCSPESP